MIIKGLSYGLQFACFAFSVEGVITPVLNGGSSSRRDSNDNSSETQGYVLMSRRACRDKQCLIMRQARLLTDANAALDDIFIAANLGTHLGQVVASPGQLTVIGLERIRHGFQGSFAVRCFGFQGPAGL